MKLEVKVLDGFWADRIQVIKTKTIYSVYNRFLETGRFEALKCKESQKKSHIFWDSDVAKWIEAVAYILQTMPDSKLEALADAAISDICKNQREDGYFNSYFLVYEPDNIFKCRSNHELYNAGHLIEAAIAYKKATGKNALFKAMRKYADLIYRVFFLEKSADFTTPGHEGIELALLKLYEETKDEKYLELAEYFIKERGVREENDFFGRYSPEYNQSHATIYEQNTAEGHAVRAMYYYIALARLSKIKKDKKLANLCLSIFDDIIQHKVYITGGIGSSHVGEAFSCPYNLPNETAYTETCAAIGLFWFCKEIFELSGNIKALELADRVLYNNILAAISLDGKAFFYSNPLAANVTRSVYAKKVKSDWLPDIRRAEIFETSCCPPNISRFFANLHTEICRVDDGAVYIDHIVPFQLDVGTGVVEISTDLPFKNMVKAVNTSGARVYLRIPSWSNTFIVNGAKQNNTGGYIFLEEGETQIELALSPTRIYANTQVTQDVGKCAMEYGYFVLCAEGLDNISSIAALGIAEDLNYCLLDKKDGLHHIVFDGYALHGKGALYSKEKPVKKRVKVDMIPYFEWANREETDMSVWLLSE